MISLRSAEGLGLMIKNDLLSDLLCSDAAGDSNPVLRKMNLQDFNRALEKFRNSSIHAASDIRPHLHDSTD